MEITQILQLTLVLSAFVSGVAMPLFPNPAVREGSQKVIWAFALAVGTYILLLAVCTVLPNYLMVMPSSLMALGAGYVCGVFTKKEGELLQKTARPGSKVKPVTQNLRI